MSFDIVNGRTNKKYGLNPFGTGQRLSTIFTLAEEEPLKVSIPLEQGSVFRHDKCHIYLLVRRLNPFGTGQCLSTDDYLRNLAISCLSQSLWNRAVSFDAEYTADHAYK